METTKLVKAFETELNLTEEGFIELTEQKKGLVIDVKTEEGFKLARKERTERNKTIEGVDRLAIDGKAAVDEARNILKDRINKIYAPTVTSFEAEELRRKEEKKRIAKEEAERIEKIREQINSIRQFSNNLFGKSSEELQGTIEAVDMIDVSENFAELTQEAMAVKKETLAELNQALSSAIQNEQLEEEREILRQEREAQEEKNRINELKAKAQERLNNLIMIPSGFFGKSSGEINNKIDSLISYEVKEEEFGELFHQANASKEQVIQQLNNMFDQQLAIEAFEAEQKSANEPHKEQAETPEPTAEDALKEAIATDEKQDKKVKCTGGHIVTSKKEITPHDRMISQVQYWADEYGVHGGMYSDLLNILNQYK